MNANCVTIAFCVCFISGLTRGAKPNERPDVLPPGSLNEWSLVPENQLPRLSSYAQFTEIEVRELLTSNAPLDRGLGIFVLDQHGDVDGLVEFRHLLEDHAPTIPSAELSAMARHMGAQTGVQQRTPQSVGQYMSLVYERWFGVRITSVREANDLVARVGDPELCVQVWVHRLGRAASDPRKAEYLSKGWASPIPDSGIYTPQEVHDGIAALPPDIRWVIAAIASQKQVWHFDESARSAYVAPACTDAKAFEWCASAAAELGGKIDPEASDAWQEAAAIQQFGGTDLKQAAIARLKELAPELVADEATVEQTPAESKPDEEPTEPGTPSTPR